mgnify:CR=1 FL=1
MNTIIITVTIALVIVMFAFILLIIAKKKLNRYDVIGYEKVRVLFYVLLYIAIGIAIGDLIVYFTCIK